MATQGGKHSGIGMTSTRTRDRMIERLRADGIRDEVVLAAMVVTAAATHVPSALLKYLKTGGRMVLPLAQAGVDGDRVQRLTVIEATPGGLREQLFDAVRFVPLLPGLA